MPDVISTFKGEYHFLSNFYFQRIFFKDRYYPTSEHAFHSEKFANELHKTALSNISFPAKAKEYANARRHEFVEGWYDGKNLEAMEAVLITKFENKFLRKKLLATKDATLIEGNTWGDTFWGQVNGVGENHLGKLLMKIRDKMRKGLL